MNKTRLGVIPQFPKMKKLIAKFTLYVLVIFAADSLTVAYLSYFYESIWIPFGWIFALSLLIAAGIFFSLSKLNLKEPFSLILAAVILNFFIHIFFVQLYIMKPEDPFVKFEYVGVRTLDDNYVIDDEVFPRNSEMVQSILNGNVSNFKNEVQLERQFYSWRYALLLKRYLPADEKLLNASYPTGTIEKIIFSLRVIFLSFFRTIAFAGLPFLIVIIIAEMKFKDLISQETLNSIHENFYQILIALSATIIALIVGALS